MFCSTNMWLFFFLLEKAILKSHPFFHLILFISVSFVYFYSHISLSQFISFIVNNNLKIKPGNHRPRCCFLCDCVYCLYLLFFTTQPHTNNTYHPSPPLCSYSSVFENSKYLSLDVFKLWIRIMCFSLFHTHQHDETWTMFFFCVKTIF